MTTIGRTRLRCFALACRAVGGRLRTIAASSRRFILRITDPRVRLAIVHVVEKVGSAPADC